MSPAPVRIVRDLRLDLFRGLALLLIFLDHIPSIESVTSPHGIHTPRRSQRR
jgi:hypothetical protein